jgi:hypothetical protein
MLKKRKATPALWSRVTVEKMLKQWQAVRWPAT